MKWDIKIFLFLLLLSSQSFTQENPGARQIALSHSDAALSNDAFALFNNPAGLSELKLHQAGLYYSPSPFGLTELSNGFASFTYPTSFGTIGTGFMIYGFELYKETELALAYGRKIYKNFSAGITVFYKNISIKNYGNKGFLLFNIGGIVKINDQVNLGFVFENLTRTTINDEDNQIPVVYWTGISYKIIDDLNLFAAIKKEVEFNPSLRFGAEYNLLEFLQLRVGTANEPDVYSVGIGIIYNVFQFDYAVFKHYDLGLTHQFGLITHF